MSTPLLVIVSILYAGVAVSYAGDGQYGMALAFVCYSVANIGFIWATN